MKTSPVLAASAVLLAAACSSSAPEVALAKPESASMQIDQLLATGRFPKGEAWRLDLNHAARRPCADDSLEVHGDLLVVQDQDMQIRALDLQHGVHRWVVDFGMPLTQQVGASQTGLTMVSGDDLVSVNRETGARLIDQSEVHLDFWPSCEAVEAAGSIFVGREAPYGVQSINPKTGRSGWLYSTDSPVIALVAQGEGGGVQVIAMTADGLLFSLAPWRADLAASQRANWKIQLRGTRLRSPLAVSANYLYFGAEDQSFYCVDAGGGQVKWKAPCSCMFSDAQPVVAGGDVYCRGDRGLFAFQQQSGQIKWICAEGARLVSRIGNLCYVELPDLMVGVLEAETGKEVARFSIAGLPHVPSVPGGGIFVAGDGAGNLFALR